MKTPRLAVMAIACLVAYVPLHSQNTAAKAESINAIVTNSSTDSIQYVERLAAYLFHEKINSYRATRQLPALAWDDTLWLASRNHSQWMSVNDKLSHDQESGTQLFTGKSPGDRYAFASNNAGKAKWCGENALYNYSAYSTGTAALAEHIAQYALQQWQESPGHNANMLASEAAVEGTAFIIVNERVWATSLFARQPAAKGYAPTAFAKPVTDKFSTTAPDTPVIAYNTTVGKPAKKETTFQMEKSIETALKDNYYSAAAPEKSLKSAATKHASYMSLHNTSDSEERKGKSRFTGTTPKKRVKKANRVGEFFKGIRTRVVELTFKKNYAVNTFTSDMAIADAKNKFNKDRTATGEVRGYGMEVKVKKLKDEYAVFIVVLERRLKSDEDNGTAEADFDE